MIRRPPRSTLFPTRRSSDLPASAGRAGSSSPGPAAAAAAEAACLLEACGRCTPPGRPGFPATLARRRELRPVVLLGQEPLRKIHPLREFRHLPPQIFDRRDELLVLRVGPGG